MRGRTLRKLASSAWLRSILQPVTYLGVTILVCVYATLAYLLVEDRKAAVVSATRQNENIAILFERLVFRSFKNVDDRIKLAREFYQRDPSGINLQTSFADLNGDNHLTFQYAIVGADGFVAASSIGGPVIGAYLGDQKSFIVHANKFRLIPSLSASRRRCGEEGYRSHAG